MAWRVFAAAVIVGAAITAACSKADIAKPPVPAGPPADPSTLGIVAGQFPGPLRGALAVLSPRGSEPLPPPASTPVMDQVQLQFIPDMLIARVGFPVSFHSTDSELHNINVRKPGKRLSEFNRSIPPGGSFEYVFEESGFYDVHCDIHPAMSAEIFVGSTPFVETLSAEGTFAFENVPPGAYTLTVYNGAATIEKQVEVTRGQNTVSFDGV